MERGWGSWVSVANPGLLLGPLLADLRRLEVVWAVLSLSSGLCWRSWAVLGCVKAVLDRSWGICVRSWTSLGSSVGGLAPSRGRL